MGEVVIGKGVYRFAWFKKTLVICLSVVAVLFLEMITMVIYNDELIIVSHISAQIDTTASGNMTAPMMESARFHLKAADELLMEGNIEAALDQINLAEI